MERRKVKIKGRDGVGQREGTETEAFSRLRNDHEQFLEAYESELNPFSRPIAALFGDRNPLGGTLFCNEGFFNHTFRIDDDDRLLPRVILSRRQSSPYKYIFD